MKESKRMLHSQQTKVCTIKSTKKRSKIRRYDLEIELIESDDFMKHSSYNKNHLNEINIQNETIYPLNKLIFNV